MDDRRWIIVHGLHLHLPDILTQCASTVPTVMDGVAQVQVLSIVRSPARIHRL
jgi:hypothetical protein